MPVGPTLSPRAGHEAVVFNGRMWVVGGSDNNTRYNDVWSSADGVNWVLEQANAAFSPRYTYSLVVLNNAMWLFAGSATPAGTSPAVGLQDAWRSTDGRTTSDRRWRDVAAGNAGCGLQRRNSPVLLNHSNKLYVIGGFSDWSAAFGHPIGAP